MWPPEYPVVTEVTPFKCSNTPCTPQKQPPASTADSWPLAAAKGASMAGFGKGIPGVAGGRAPGGGPGAPKGGAKKTGGGKPLPTTGGGTGRAPFVSV